MNKLILLLLVAVLIENFPPVWLHIPHLDQLGWAEFIALSVFVSAIVLFFVVLWTYFTDWLEKEYLDWLKKQ